MPNAESRPRPPAFEQAALDELAQLQRQLETLRQRRQAAAAAYDAFLKTFDQPRVEDGTRPSRASREVSEGPRPGRLTPVSADAPPKRTSPVVQQHRAPAPRWMIGAGAVVILLLAMLVFMPRGHQGAAEDPQTAPAAPAPPDMGVAASVPVPPPAPPAAQIVTERVVWVRVTADGARVLERELPAGARVPLDVSGTVVVRAGDAGALRVLIRGEDQGPLGLDGIVVTRTFRIE